MVWAEAIAASSTTRTNSSANSNSRMFSRFLGCEVFSNARVAITPPVLRKESGRESTRKPRIMRLNACVFFAFIHATVPHSHSKRADAGDVLAQDQRMNVVRSFVGLDGFQVHHMAHDRIIVGNAVAT